MRKLITYASLALVLAACSTPPTDAGPDEGSFLEATDHLRKPDNHGTGFIELSAELSEKDLLDAGYALCLGQGDSLRPPLSYHVTEIASAAAQHLCPTDSRN